MRDHDDSTGTLESQDPSSAEASGSNVSSVDARVSACGKLVDEALEKDWPSATLADALKDLGL